MRAWSRGAPRSRSLGAAGRVSERHEQSPDRDPEDDRANSARNGPARSGSRQRLQGGSPTAAMYLRAGFGPLLADEHRRDVEVRGHEITPCRSGRFMEVINVPAILYGFGRQQDVAAVEIGPDVGLGHRAARDHRVVVFTVPVGVPDRLPPIQGPRDPVGVQVFAAVTAIDAEPFRQSSRHGLLFKCHQVFPPGSIGAEQIFEQIAVVNRELLGLIDPAEQGPISIVREQVRVLGEPLRLIRIFDHIDVSLPVLCFEASVCLGGPAINLFMDEAAPIQVRDRLDAEGMADAAPIRSSVL